MSPKLTTSTLAAVLGLVLSAAPATRGDEFKVVPAAMLREEYDDNVFFSSTSPKSSSITTLSAALTLIENTERLSSSLETRLDGLLYSADQGLNAVEQRYSAQGSYFLTPRFKMAASAAYSEQSRPDRFIETTGLVVRQTSSRQTYSVSGDAAVSEKLNTHLGYGYDWTDYHDPSVSNVAGHTVRLGGDYDLGTLLPRAKLLVWGGFNSFVYSSSTVDNFSARVGASYLVDELWSVQAELGGRMTHSELDLDGRTHRSDSPGWVANLAAFYRGETGTASLTLSRDVQNADARSGAVESTSFAVALSSRLSYELSAVIGGSCHWNSSGREEFAGQAIEERTFTFNPSLGYQVSRNVAINLGYELALVHDVQAGTNTQRNKVFITLTVERALFE